ncbi:MAG TPA: hypothetical protein VJU16_05225, partial [Planctomycetota bacterium]|nr:hypothetical protein [Planctomycetota bacterium]
MKATVRGNRRRGIVLIVVLSCLATLSLVGVAFTVLNSMERTTAGNYRLTVQARLLARAGVEYAISRLSSTQALSSSLVDGGEWRYYGNDVAGNSVNDRDVSLATAKRPSYALLTSTGKIDQVRLKYDEKRILSVGLSGRLRGGEYFPDGNIYSLEVRDLSGCIYVNDGLKMQGGNRSSVSENLKRILNVLGRQESVGVGNLGDLVVDNRPTLGGWATWHHLSTVLRSKGGLKDETLDRLEKYLTVHSWVDTNVVNPVPFGPSSARLYPVQYERGEPSVYRRGPGKDFRNMIQPGAGELGWIDGPGEESAISGTTAAVYAHDELFPGYVEVVHRAPVNINSAPEEVLIALLADLRGVFLMEKRTGGPVDLGPGDISYQTTQWLVPGHNFQIPQSKYTWEYMGHTYSGEKWSPPGAISENKKWSERTGATTHSPGAQALGSTFDRDELGWLTSTVPFSLNATGKGSSARAVASEIILCREGKGDYGTLPFGGPFKTWAQFNAFCDYLAQGMLLMDDRFPEEHRRRQGAQALADVLKANFNPNYTPNEINPDRNLYLMVDKTDLIVNSTEFCFLPTGYFQVNSLGRILNADAKVKHGSPVHEVAATAGARAIVQVHELYRETTQRQFYRGEAPPSRSVRTNNGLTVECGPESDNDPLIYGDHFSHGRQRMSRELDGDAQYYERGFEFDSGWGYEASGYLALPTAGGPEELKNKYTMDTTHMLPAGRASADAIF